MTNKLKATCVWYTDDSDGDVWETNCGQTFQFNDGGQKENRFRFCYFCGKPLEELLRSESSEIDSE